MSITFLSSVSKHRGNFLVVCAAAASASIFFLALDRRPSIVKLDRVNHDFGITVSGVPLRTTFKITNTSSHPLRIDQMVSSCGCITHDPVDEVVPPGDFREIAVEVDTTGFSAPADLAKSVAVVASQRGRSETALFSLAAKLRRPFVGDKPAVPLIKDDTNARYEGQMTFTRVGLSEHDFATLNVDQLPDGFACRVRERSSDRVVFDVNARAQYVNSAPIMLSYTCAGEARTHRLLCSSTRSDKVRVIPSCLIANLRQTQDSSQPPPSVVKTIQLTSPSGNDVEIVGVDFEPATPKLPIQWERDPSRVGELRLEIDQRALRDPILASAMAVTYRVKTRPAISGVISVPVYLISENSRPMPNRDRHLANGGGD